MKRIAIATLLLSAAFTLEAQTPQWAIHPDYTRIKMLDNGLFQVEKQGKLGLMNDQEKVVVPLEYDSIAPFKSRYAVLFQEEKPVAYTDEQGAIKEITDMTVTIVGEPCFRDGYLTLRNANGYYLLRAADNMVFGPFTGVLPFCEGHAVVFTPEKPNHVLDGPYVIRLFNGSQGGFVRLQLEGYDPDDVDFISSVSFGKVIIALKKRFFEYDVKRHFLKPLATDGNIDNKKSRVLAFDRPVPFVTTETGFTVNTRQGELTFDQYMRLTGINYTGQNAQKHDVPYEPQPQRESLLEVLRFNGHELLGLSYKGKEILSPQFESVRDLLGNNALVKVNGRYGVVKVDPYSNCNFVLNDNMNLGFEHRTLVTNIRAVCPPSMKIPLLSMTSMDDRCTVNVDTRRETMNVETAVLSYDCTLRIPDDIGLEQSPAETKIALIYDGLKLTPRTIPYYTWYVNNYTVEMLKHQIDGSVLTVDLLVRNNASSGRNFFKDVSIEASDSVSCSLTKQTEELYSARLYGWKKDDVRFSVDVTEDGCPTISYDFTLPLGRSSAKTQKTESEGSSSSPVASQGKVKKGHQRKRTEQAPAKKIFVPKI